MLITSFTPFWYSETQFLIVELSSASERVRELSGSARLSITSVNTCIVSLSAGSVPASGVHIRTLCGACAFVMYVGEVHAEGCSPFASAISQTILFVVPAMLIRPVDSASPPK